MDVWIVVLMFGYFKFAGWLHENGPWCRVTQRVAYTRTLVPGRVLTPEEMERLRKDWARRNRCFRR